MSIKEWIKWDFHEVEDPIYKNELKANRFLGVTLFFTGVVSLICLLLQSCNVFKIESRLEMVIFYSLLTFFSFSGCLLSYLTAGKKKYVKFFLLLDVIIIAVAADMFLAFYAVLVLAIPLLCVSRYADSRLCIKVALTLIVLILFDGFIAYYSNVEMDISLLNDATVKAYLEDPNSLKYWDYTVPVLLFSVIPKELLCILIGTVATINAVSTKHFTDDQISTIKKEQRITGELSLARDLQENMLPRVFPPFPNVKNFDIYANMIPAKEVGGDMYDFFLIDDQHLGLVIADVSGKGVPASLFMGMTKILVKNMLFQNKNLELAAASVNDMLCNDNPIGLFVTAWIGVLDLNNGELTFVNAGHNPPLLYQNKKLTFLKDKSGIAFGTVVKRMYKQYKIKLSKGDRLFLYTDGVTEATNVKDKLYGEDRLVKFLSNKLSCSDDEVVNSLLEDLNKFQEGREQFDDITMLSMTFNSYLEKKNVRKEFVATVENFAAVSEFIETTLEGFDISLKYINQINIAVEEIFTNIAKYGFKGETNGKATVDITFVNGIVTITTYDNSPKFDTFAAKEPDITLAAEDRQIGGLGILMVRRLMDEVSYKYENGMNVISLVKKVF